MVYMIPIRIRILMPKRFDHLKDIGDELFQYTTDLGSKVGTGGMESKLIAARTALQFGVKVFIGTGEGADKLVRILEGHGDGTYVEKEILHSCKYEQTMDFFILSSGQTICR